MIGKSLSGINIYSFEYKDKSFGKGVFQGVIADEVAHIEGVVTRLANGLDLVEYGKIDVEFKQI